MRFLIPLLALAGPALAEPPVIEAVEAVPDGDGWRVSVTLSHPDTGWDHYADGWRIEDDAGHDLGTRVLHHPHVNEQPFTRSLRLALEGDGPFHVRARCSVDGWSETRVPLVLPD
ncbi:hypothetical protein [Pseudoponticoccus marisrubri]|uniref:Secreted protein n=1 Tax=Pseudoponticoccus marisrubri TaxID=1685382 RepID=A0A0W7WJ95_9RHOB|nr:hypothetical protein [Pseudoponticoccus marisrubri]KUF10633.1 hypothetical protein AVJ23_12235 [Pseudoponticoccus marisrubri]